MTDTVLLALTDDGDFRARVAHTTEAVREALRRHQPGRLGALAVARALSVAAVFPAEWEKNDRVSLQWTGRGPLGAVFAEVRREGNLRAYLQHNDAEPCGELSAKVRGAGLGLLPGGALVVIRQVPSGRHVQGKVPLKNGEVDEDVEAYFDASEQVPTRVRALVDLDENGGVRASAAVLVQAMAGADPDELPRSEDLERLDPKVSLDELLRGVFGERPYKRLEERPLAYRCPCSKERIEAGLKLLDEGELFEMLAVDKGAEVTCRFCAEVYRFDGQDLARLIDEKRGVPHGKA